MCSLTRESSKSECARAHTHTHMTGAWARARNEEAISDACLYDVAHEVRVRGGEVGGGVGGWVGVTHTRTHICTHTHTHTHTYSHIHTPVHTHTGVTHTHAHTHAYTRMLTHIHTQVLESGYMDDDPRELTRVMECAVFANRYTY